VNKNAQVSGNLGYTHSRGYLSNPYKVVEIAFVDPEQQFLSPSPDVLYVNVNSILEKRPDTRNQWQLDMRYAQYIDAADAALHLNYGLFPRRLGHPRAHAGSRVGAAVCRWLDRHASRSLLHAVGRKLLRTVSRYRIKPSSEP
jgi:hypothetical protein